MLDSKETELSVKSLYEDAKKDLVLTKNSPNKEQLSKGQQ
jgi:hypothetical protein